MSPSSQRLDRERRTILAMISIYCRARHAAGPELCPDCQQLVDYALQRVDHCPFQVQKPTCAKCPIHCYQPVRRVQIRQVMKFSGPRILFRHPILTIAHLMDGLKKPQRSKT